MKTDAYRVKEGKKVRLRDWNTDDDLSLIHI